MHHGITVRHVVAVGVGIEEQVRRVHHPDATFSGKHRVGHVEPLDEDLARVVATVAVGVLVDRDKIGPRIVMRRSERHLVIVGPVIAVATEHAESRRIRILLRVDHPETPASIIAEVEGLGDIGLGERFWPLR